MLPVEGLFQVPLLLKVWTLAAAAGTLVRAAPLPTKAPAVTVVKLA